MENPISFPPTQFESLVGEDVPPRFHRDPTDAVPRMTLINFNWPTPAMLFFRSPPSPLPPPWNAHSLHPYSLCAESIALHRRSLGRERGQCRSSRPGRTTRRLPVDLGAARGGKHWPGTINARQNGQDTLALVQTCLQQRRRPFSNNKWSNLRNGPLFLHLGGSLALFQQVKKKKISSLSPRS